MTKNRQNSLQFIISYNGQDIERSHSMNIEDLAPSLLALDKVFQLSNKLLNGTASDTLLKVSAQRKGSFEVVLYLAQYLPEMFQIVKNYDHKALLQILFGKRGVFELIKNLGKNKIKIQIPINIQKMELHGNIYNAETIKIFNKTKDENKKFLKPLQNGIEEIKFLNKEEENNILNFSINNREAEFFLNNQIIEDVNTITNKFQKYYYIKNITFEKQNGKLKWKLSDNNQSIITVLIEDKTFVNEVESSSLSFSKGDILKCQVREEQKEIGGKLSSSYFIEKILKHKPASQ